MFEIAPFVPCLNKDPRYADYEIGDYTYGHPKIVEFGEGIKLKIGKFCSVADDSVFMLGGEHRLDMVTTYPFAHFFQFANSFHDSHPRLRGNITVGNDVWIGQEAMILSGVSIGDGAVIGARVLVARDVMPYSIVVGNPAQTIRFRCDPFTIIELLKIAWWDWPIEQIAEAMPLMLSDVDAFVERYKNG